MKYILTCTLFILLLSCKDQNKTDETVKNENNSENNLNALVDDPDAEGTKMLLGKIDKEGLASEEFPWFLETMKNYQVNDTLIDALQKPLQNVTIKVFMGTWCEDSQREVPALFAILDKANYNISEIEFIAVSQDKITPQEYEKEFNIEYVPTIILSKGGQELGRIVESTHGSLEEDLLAIASGKEYKHMYAE